MSKLLDGVLKEILEPDTGKGAPNADEVVVRKLYEAFRQIGLTPEQAEQAVLGRETSGNSLEESFRRIGLAPEAAKQAAVGRGDSSLAAEATPAALSEAGLDPLRLKNLTETFMGFGSSASKANEYAKEWMEKHPVITVGGIPKSGNLGKTVPTGRTYELKESKWWEAPDGKTS